MAALTRSALCRTAAFGDGSAIVFGHIPPNAHPGPDPDRARTDTDTLVRMMSRRLPMPRHPSSGGSSRLKTTVELGRSTLADAEKPSIAGKGTKRPLELKDNIRIIRKRWRVILAATLVVLAGVALATALSPKIDEAQTRSLVGCRTPQRWTISSWLALSPPAMQTASSGVLRLMTARAIGPSSW